jgi:hypothetical protein
VSCGCRSPSAVCADQLPLAACSPACTRAPRRVSGRSRTAPSSPESSKIFSTAGRAQTIASCAPTSRLRLTPTSTPSAVESMKVASERSTTSWLVARHRANRSASTSSAGLSRDRALPRSRSRSYACRARAEGSRTALKFGCERLAVSTSLSIVVFASRAGDGPSAVQAHVATTQRARAVHRTRGPSPRTDLPLTPTVDDRTSVHWGGRQSASVLV